MKKKDRPILIVVGNYKNGGNARQASVLANGLSDFWEIVAIVVTKEMSPNSFFDLNENVSLIDINNYILDYDLKNKYYLFTWKAKLEIKKEKLFSKFYRRDDPRRKLLNYTVSKKRKHQRLKWILSLYHKPIIIPLGLDYAADLFGITSKKKDSIILATKTYAEGELKSIDRDIAEAVLKGMKCVVCQTHYTMDYFKKMGAPNLEVIPNPLIMDLPPFTGNRTKRIVNFCRISREKNLELLIDAFSRFYIKFPEYSVDIYGNIINEQEQAYKDELNNRIAESGLSDVITIRPAVKNIYETVQDAAMFISTSEFEGLSNSMIEAMALGLPCICTDCDGGGAREMIEDGVNGLLVPKNNVDLLYKAMVRFAEDEQFAEQCGKAAVEVREKTAINTVITQWNNVISKY